MSSVKMCSSYTS